MKRECSAWDLDEIPAATLAFLSVTESLPIHKCAVSAVQIHDEALVVTHKDHGLPTHADCRINVNLAFRVATDEVM
jgi:hypothetical protein